MQDAGILGKMDNDGKRFMGQKMVAKSQVSASKPLEIESLSMAFIILVIGLFTASMVFIIEYFQR